MDLIPQSTKDLINQLMQFEKTTLLALLCALLTFSPSYGQRKKDQKASPPSIQIDTLKMPNLQWRNIGPFRGGRSVAVVGHPTNDQVYYFGSTGGGVWKTEDAGLSWRNISDGFFATGSVGAIAISESDPNVLYVGMGEHAVRGVMTSEGDGMYKSEDGGQSWKHIGLPNSRHIAEIRIHPSNPDWVWVAVQGALYGPSEDRGVYKTTDGGQTWRKVLYVDPSTGAADLSLDHHNPRILYAGMWDHQRTPWKIRSGGPGSGIYKSTDGGENWKKLTEGLPDTLGKVAVDVSRADPNRVYANIEAEKGGVYRSDDGGKSWKRVCSDRITVARAWYYIEIFADPQDAETVYVLNAPMLRSIDGGKSFQNIPNPHGDQHDLWINPRNPKNLILANDGGACISFNGGQSWSAQTNQPTAQFYRVIADKRVPYYLYAGQQDNSTVAIASSTMDRGIDWKDWYPVAGGEAAFIALDPEDPTLVFGSNIQGFIEVYDHRTQQTKDIMPYPAIQLGSRPKDMKYRFNWNPPLVAQPQDPQVIYFGGNQLLKTDDAGQSWTEISSDLTRNDPDKLGDGGGPFTNEGAGGENYHTLSYIACSPHQAGLIWTGADDGLVHLTKDEGATWQNVSPPGLGEALINAIEVSPHEPATAYLAVTRYKFDDPQPLIYITHDYGQSWELKVQGIAANAFVRVVREDPQTPGLLYAGTERGLYVSFDGGDHWKLLKTNFPACPITDLTIRNNDLIAATSGRAFWILDDLSALQQSAGNFPEKEMALYHPKTTYKINYRVPAGQPAQQGKNPENGIVFDYFLPEKLDTATLTLEVLNDQGKVIRTYTNQKDEKFKTWPGGPPPPQILPSQKGYNRFNWDLRKETLPSVEGVFVLGDYRGAIVPPGNYYLRLFSATDTVSAPCLLEPDPRLTVGRSAHKAQAKALLLIETTVQDIHRSVNLMRSVKKQMDERVALLEKLEGQQDLVDTGKAIVKQIVAWEENLIQPKQETFQDVINFQNQLNAELLTLKSRLESHDPQPTEGANQRLQDLIATWETHRLELLRLIEEEVGGFNRLYQERDLPILIVPHKDPKP